MKKKTKVIVSSALSMAVCASLIAGGTLALFSSESNVNVAITSGKVEVVASVTGLEGYSAKWDEATGDYIDEPATTSFTNGGTFSYDEGTLTLNNISPGDGVKFSLEIENNSTISIQYRVQLSIPEEAAEGAEALEVTFGEKDTITIGKKSLIAQPWDGPIEVGEDIEAVQVKIELPWEAGNKYAEKDYQLQIGVYAVQANAHVTDPDPEAAATIFNALDFYRFAEEAKTNNFAGQTVELGGNIYLGDSASAATTFSAFALADTEPASITEQPWTPIGTTDNPFKGTFEGNGYTIYGLEATGSEQVGLFGVTENATIQNVNISGAEIEAKDKKAAAGVLIGEAKGTLTVTNVKVEDSSVKAAEEATEATLGALVGKATGTDEVKEPQISVEGVDVQLNESDSDLSGGNLIGDGANITYTGDSDLEFNPVEGFAEKIEIRDGKEETRYYEISTATGLAYFATTVNDGTTYVGLTVSLTADIDLKSIENWTPIGTSGICFGGIFNGNGHTISNLTSNVESGYVGLFGAISSSAQVSSIKLDHVNVSGKEYVAPLTGYVGTFTQITDVHVTNATVTTNHYGAGIAGYINGTLKNCSVDTFSITVVPSLKTEGTGYEDGHRVGGITGFLAYGSVENCTVSNGTISAYRSVAGLVGYAQQPGDGGTAIKGNHVSNVVITVDRTENYYESDDYSADEICIKQAKEMQDNTFENVQIKFKGVDLAEFDGRTFIASKTGLESFADKVKGGENYAGKTVVLTEDIDLESAEWTPISEFRGIFEGEGHTIFNLKIEKPEQNQVGFFSSIPSGYVRNLVFENVDIKGQQEVGTLAGGAFTVNQIDNITVRGNIKIEGNYKVGGITGGSYGHLTNCTVNGLSGSYIKGVYKANNCEGDNVGGIIGYTGELNNTTEGHIDNCHVIGVEVSGTRKVGGVVGYLHHGQGVSNSSFENGTVKCTADDNYISSDYARIAIGGIVGQAHNINAPESIKNNRVSEITIEAPKSYTFETVTSGQTLTSAILGNVRDCNTSAGIAHAKKVYAEGNTAENVTVNALLKNVLYADNGRIVSLLVENVEDIKSVQDAQTKNAEIFRNWNTEQKTTVNFAEGIYDFSDEEWKSFSGGRFNYIALGKGATIKNMSMTLAQWRGGFVDSLSDGRVENFTFENATIIGEQAGVVAGHTMGGTIKNVTLKGEVSVKYEKASEEEWSGIGFVLGVLGEGTVALENVNIAEGTKLTIDYGKEFTTKCTFKDYFMGYEAAATYTGEVHEGEGVEIVVKNMPQEATFENNTVRPTDGMYLDPGVNLTIDGATEDGGKTVINVKHTAFNYFSSTEGILSGKIVIRNVHFKGTDGQQNGYAMTLGFNSNAEIIFENCEFENMYCAIYCNQNETGNAKITITGCTFTSTAWGYGLSVPDNLNKTIHVTFESNTGLQSGHDMEKL